jgi:hypothetical protein
MGMNGLVGSDGWSLANPPQPHSFVSSTFSMEVLRVLHDANSFKASDSSILDSLRSVPILRRVFNGLIVR